LASRDKVDRIGKFQEFSESDVSRSGAALWDVKNPELHNAGALQAAIKLFGLMAGTAIFRKLIDPMSMRGDDRKQAAMFSCLTLASWKSCTPARATRRLQLGGG